MSNLNLSVGDELLRCHLTDLLNEHFNGVHHLHFVVSWKIRRHSITGSIKSEAISRVYNKTLLVIFL